MASFEDIEQENINYATENYDRDIAMSQRFAQAQKSVDWNDHPFLNLEDANKASRNPIERVFDESDLKNLKSDTGDIAWNSFRKGVLDLQSFGDKAEMALGNTLAGISGNTLGTEMRDRAADSLMKTMEESRFIDSNYGDAETWTARFVGGGMSMGEMLAVGAATGGVGLGAYVGTLSLSDGALNDMAKYQEEHGSLDGYKTDPVNLALDYANAVFQVATEKVGGAGRFLNGKVLKAGKTGSAIAKETLINFLQESAQGAAADLTEVLKGNQNADVLLENATGYLKDGVVAGVLGGVLGGATYKLNKHRAIQNLNEINKVLHPDKNEQEINKISEEVFAKTEEKMEKSFVPELVAQTEAVNDKGKIRDNVQSKVAAMYEDADMSEKQKAKTIEATTTLELENMLYDSIERKIPLTSHPLLQGEVNELGWFREGIPEHRRAEIESLRQEYVSMRDELKTENESADKNYQKIEELETKIELFKKDIAKKLADMAVADKQMIQDMIEEQRKIVRESQARKQMLAETKRKAEKAAQKQDKEEAILAGKMATGAEKAREQRVKKETAQQTKEAKIRSLQEQRDIARTIKAVKVSLAQQKQTPAQMQKQAIEPQVMFQDQFDLADENARLDDIYPEYTGETIEVDGKERTVYNSNGDRIAKSKEALTNFWRWFGDSKVVDAQGRPLVVYHGTKAQFDEFLGEKIGQSGTSEGVGFYFTNDENVAKGFGDVMSVYLKLEKPIYAYAQVFMAEDYDGDLDIMEANAEMIKDASIRVLDDLKAKGYEFYNETTAQMADIYTETDYDSLVNTIEMYIKDGIKAEEYDENKLYNDIREAIIKEFGFDGFKTKGYGSSNATVYVALMSNQIKSVDNRGTYSEDTGNIYLQTTEDLFDNIMTGSVDDKDGEHRVHINPTPRTLQGILNLEGSQRLLISKKTGNWYFANSLNSIHKDMLQTLIDNGYETGNREDVFNSDLFDTYMIDNGSEQKYEGNYFIYGTKANISWFMGNPFGMDKIKSNFESVIEKYPKLKDVLGEFDEKKNATLLAKRLEKEIRVEESKIKNFGINTEYFDSLTQRKNALMEKYNIKQEDIDNFYNNQKNAAFDSLSKLREFYLQTKTTGKGKDTFRGAYVPEYRFIQATENMDASTLNHELAHDWGQEYFRWARSGKASESFLRSWGAVEKAIGITDKDTYFTYDASEKFARAYEGWLLQRKDWADILKIDTPDERKAVEEMMEDYRQELVDIYDSLLESSKYFKDTYGEIGELKPELAEFFERASRYDDIELRQKRGEITEEQATDEKLNHLLETAVNGQAEQEQAGAPEMMEDLRKAENDTERFETEGGNRKALQTRLDRIALAKDLTANEEAMGRYDSHRDMLAVAEQADEFVKNRRDDALAIINGEMAEQDGLYASDLYTALERVANATGDFDLIDELRHSKIANEMAKELGQRVAGFRNYKGSGDVDVMSTLKSVEKQLNKGYTDDMKALAREDVESLIAELKIADNTAELDKFFDEMECK